ncbi:hypothetical protein JTB14_011557 [Gonioctena quinquepunctata]|nr:hypothetical protein JTB14_011557 [Gonioctena quinquepunctata]
MNEEIDESEFYHEDFTTASEWEVFIARIEEIINQWKTDDSKLEFPIEIKKPWDIKTEKLTFADVEFTLNLFRKADDNPESSESSEIENEKRNEIPRNPFFDFELYDESKLLEHSCLSTWYGLNEYIVLAPSGNVAITTESKIKVLLSSAYIVSSNLKCGGPIFVQIREKWQKCYLGVFQNDEVRINYEMVHLRRGPPHYQYLTGLLDLFKTKIMSPSNIDNIAVSVQLTFTLSDFGRFSWKQDTMMTDNFDVESVFILPLGVSVDPINALVLKTTWSHLPDHLIVDGESYSDFDPVAAPKWSCLVKMTNEPVCLLADALTEFLQSLNNNSTVYDVLGDFATLPSVENNPLDVLTEPAVPTISALLTRAARRSLSKNKRSNPPISETILVPLLYFLFPDADESTSFPYGVKEDKEAIDRSNSHEWFKKLEEDFKGFKTCGSDSLIWRLSIVLAHCLQSLGGMRTFSHIWYEFVQEMRYRWEKSMLIPGTNSFRVISEKPKNVQIQGHLGAPCA